MRMRLVLRHVLLSSIVLIAAVPAAAADDSLTHAEVAPSAQSPPETQPELSDPFACPPDICGLKLPEDLWKKDALAKQRREHINAASVIKDRSRREELDTQFIETPVIETQIGNSSCWLTPKFVTMNDQSILKLMHCGF
jgi:hypothetical protein